MIATEVVEHVDDTEALIGELYRVGKQGAQYLITVPHHISESIQLGIAAQAYFEKPSHVRIIDGEQFDSLVCDVGLEIEQYEPFGAFWTIWRLLFWNTLVNLENLEHEMLSAGTRTWPELMNTEDAARLKRVLDSHIPKSQAIIARKSQSV